MDTLAGRVAPSDAERAPADRGKRWRRPTVSYDGQLAGGEAPSRRDSVRRRLLALADVLGILGAYGAAWLFLSPPGQLEDRLVLAVTLPVWITINKLLRLYDRDANLIHKSTLDEFPQIFVSMVLGTALLFMLSPPVFGVALGRSEIAAFVAFAMVLVPAFRGLVRAWVVRRYPPERCVIVGSGLVAGLVARKIAMHAEYGVEPVGFVDVPHADDEPGEDDGLLGDLDRFADICRELKVERVVIAFSSLSHEDLIQVIRTSKALQLKITVVPRLFEAIGHSVEVDQLEGMTLLGLRGFTRTRSSLACKRAIDFAGASLGVVLLSPLLMGIAVAIKLTSRGPVLFAQRRIGRGNKPFWMYKFRTMVHGADELKSQLAHLNEADSPMFKITADPRVTRVGRTLRRFSLDELPQLWNVLRGEMSLVGPRPLVPTEDDQVIGYHRQRLELTPGLTGPWQVLGRTAIPFQEMVKLDYLYVAEWSLWNDIKLLIRTAPVVFRADGR